MSTPFYDTDLTDAAWALVAPVLPAARPGGRPRTTNLRAVLNAIFYLMRTGCQWRMLPRELPPCGTVYHYFQAWQNSGVWVHLHRVLYEQARQAGATILQFKQNRPSPLTLLSLMDSCCLYTTCNRIIRKTAPLCRLHSPKHGRPARGGDSRAGTLTDIYFLIFRALHDHSSQPPGVTDHDLGPNNDLLCNSKVRRVPVAS